MSGFTIVVNPQATYSIKYAAGTGPQGATGSNASATTDASLLSSGTLNDARLSTNVVKTSDLLAAPTWADVFARTTDPGVLGEPWNDNGYFRFSFGATLMVLQNGGPLTMQNNASFTLQNGI